MYNYGLGDDPSSPSLLEQSLEMAERMDESQSDPVVIKLEEYRDNVESVAYSPDGKYVCSGSMDNTVRLWNTETGETLRTLKGHRWWVKSVSFSPDGLYVCSGSWDTTVRLWNVETGVNIHTFIGHTEGVRSVLFSPDGKYICSGSDDRTMRLWEVATETVRTFNDHRSSTLAFSPDGKYIASGSDIKKVQLWITETGALVHTFNGHTDLVEGVAFSPDQRYICSGSRDSTVRLWDTATGETKRTFGCHTSGVETVAFSPDGKYICAGGNKGIQILESGLTMIYPPPPILLEQPLQMAESMNGIEGESVCSYCYYCDKKGEHVPAEFVSISCGHFCFCEKHKTETKKEKLPCPICQKEIIGFERIHIFDGGVDADTPCGQCTWAGDGTSEPTIANPYPNTIDHTQRCNLDAVYVHTRRPNGNWCGGLIFCAKHARLLSTKNSESDLHVYNLCMFCGSDPDPQDPTQKLSLYNQTLFRIFHYVPEQVDRIPQATYLQQRVYQNRLKTTETYENEYKIISKYFHHTGGPEDNIGIGDFEQEPITILSFLIYNGGRSAEFRNYLDSYYSRNGAGALKTLLESFQPLQNQEENVETIYSEEAYQANALLRITRADFVKNRPLHLAVMAKNTYMVKTLMEFMEIAEVDFNSLKNGNGQTPLHLASLLDDSKKGHEILNLLLRKSPNYVLDVNAKDLISGKTALHYTILHFNLSNSNNDCTKLLYLLQNGADINAADDRDTTCLDLACISACYDSETKIFDVIPYLLLAKADINRLHYGQTNLNRLIEEGDYDEDEDTGLVLPQGVNTKSMELKIKKMLDWGADPNICNPDQDWPTCLQTAVVINMPLTIIKLLLEYSADVNYIEEGEFGKTALTAYVAVFMADEHFNPEVMTLLINAGADVNIPEKNPPLYIAMNQKYDGDQELAQNSTYSNAAILQTKQILLDSGANHICKAESEPFHYLFLVNSVADLELFMKPKYRMDINVLNKDEQTPMLKYIIDGGKDVFLIKAFINKGTNVFLRDKNDKSCISYINDLMPGLGYINHLCDAVIHKHANDADYLELWRQALENELASMHLMGKFEEDATEETAKALSKADSAADYRKKQNAWRARENDQSQIGPNKKR